jgi:hypothetical protein
VVLLAASVVVVLAQSTPRRRAGLLRGVVLATGLGAGMLGGLSNAATLI